MHLCGALGNEKGVAQVRERIGLGIAGGHKEVLVTTYWVCMVLLSTLNRIEWEKRQ